MKRILILSLALFAAPAVLADTTPVINSITPTTSPAAGGVDVTITGSNFSTTVFCIVPCPTTVTFGDIKVVPARTTDTEIVVKAPAHTAGTVNVTVTTGGGSSATAPNAFTYGDSFDAQWEPVLVPVYIEGQTPGAGGSLWKTDLWIQNDGSSDLTLAPWPCPAPLLCPALFPLPHTLKPGEGVHGLGPASLVPSPVPGRLVYLSRTASENPSMNLRVWDASRSALDAGTEVPLVRERELLTKKVSLLNIPVPSNRVLLRVYDVALTDAAFHVRVFLQSEDASVTPMAELDLRAKTSDAGPLRTTPAYAETYVPMPAVAAAAFNVRVEVTPLTPGSRYWTFVSVTNETTSHVTTVTPQ